MSNIAGLSIDVGDELSKSSTIYKNVDQGIIITTEDKLKIVLVSTKDILNTQREWWTPAGLIISFIATLVTSDFRNYGLTKETWEAIFILLTIGSGIWLGISVRRLYKFRHQGDLESILNKFKTGNPIIKEKETIVLENRKLLIDIPLNHNWWLNHWQKNYARIINKSMVFKGDGKIEDVDGSHIDLKDFLEIGKNYEVSCFVKSAENSNCQFQLWLHDNLETQINGVDIKTDFFTPSVSGDEIKLLFTPTFNKDLRIHLQYAPGQGQIEVTRVNIMEMVRRD